MSALAQPEREKFLSKHLRHRLTLLRTLRERKNARHNYQGHGDIYRCVKDSNLIAVRLMLDFMGLKGELDGSTYKLAQNTKRLPDDVKIDDFIGRLLTPADVPPSSHRVLAGVYKRADKELAHLTTVFNDEFNEEDALIEAATAVEDLFKRFLYEPLDKQLPQMDA